MHAEQTRFLQFFTSTFYVQIDEQTLSKTFSVDRYVFRVYAHKRISLDVLTRALSHLRATSGIAAFSFHIVTGKKSADRNAAFFHWLQATYGKTMIRVQSEQFKFLYNPGVHGSRATFSFFSFDRQVGIYWCEDDASIPWYEIAAPFRILFHWAMAKRGYELIHAGCIGTEHQAMLLVGKGGKGKTSTALTALQTVGLKYLSDDYVLIRLAKQPYAVSLYSSAKVDALTLQRFPRLRRFVHGTSRKEEKHTIFLYPGMKSKLGIRLPITTVVIPQISRTKTSELASISPAQALLALAPSTLFQLLADDTERSPFASLTSLVKKVPTYELKLSADPVEIGERTRDFLVHGERPKVSVILPVKNGARFITSALRSVFAAMGSMSHEVIVVDDGSTDRTRLALKPWMKKITFLSQKSHGPAAARNLGLKHARGEYIAFIDADDIWAPSHMVELLHEHMQHPEAQVVMGYTQRFTGTQKPFGNPLLFPSLGCALFRSSVFTLIGRFEESYAFHEDVDWYLRAREQKLSIITTIRVVTWYRMHDANMTRAWSPIDHSMLRVLAKSLKRRKHKTLSALGK